MPKLDEFNRYSQKYVKKVINASAISLQKGADEGAYYMRQYISTNSETGTTWHDTTNIDRGNNIGARKKTGAMLDAVQSTAPEVSSLKISTTFGWIEDRQNYFLLQDTGGYWLTAYGKPSGVGMGLLNRREDGGGKSTLRVLGAYTKGIKEFTDEMKRQGFESSSSIGEVF